MFENVGRTDGRRRRRRTPEHGFTISSPCEHEGSGEINKTHTEKIPYFLENNKINESFYTDLYRVNRAVYPVNSTHLDLTYCL